MTRMFKRVSPLAVLPILIGILGFVFLLWSDEAFVRPNLSYRIESGADSIALPCAATELALTLMNEDARRLTSVKGTLHVPYPLYSRFWAPPDQTFSLQLDLKGRTNFDRPLPRTTVCLPQPPRVFGYKPQNEDCSFLVEELIFTSEEEPSQIHREVPQPRMPVLGNSLSGGVFVYGLICPFFLYVTRRVFRNPDSENPPDGLLFLFPALLVVPSLFLIFGCYYTLKLPPPTPDLLIPCPVLLYPAILVLYGLWVALHPQKPKDFWTKSFFFFFAALWLAFTLIACMLGWFYLIYGN